MMHYQTSTFSSQRSLLYTYEIGEGHSRFHVPYIRSRVEKPTTQHILQFLPSPVFLVLNGTIQR